MFGLLGILFMTTSVVVCVTLLARLKPLAPVNRGFRGVIRQETRKNGFFRGFDYGVRLFTLAVKKTVKQEMVESKDEEIVCSGELWGFDGREFYGVVGMFALLTFVAVAMASKYLSCPNYLLLVLLVTGCSLPVLQLRSQRKIRQTSIERALPFVLDLIYMTMGAGLNLQQALLRVIDNLPNRESPIRFELNRLIYELRIGTSLTDAMKNFAKRVKTDTASDFAHWVIQSEEKGTSLRAIFQKQASSLRQKRSVKAEESAAKAGAAMMLPMTMMFGVVLIIVLTPLIMKMKGMDL